MCKVPPNSHTHTHTFSGNCFFVVDVRFTGSVKQKIGCGPALTKFIACDRCLSIDVQAAAKGYSSRAEANWYSLLRSSLSAAQSLPRHGMPSPSPWPSPWRRLSPRSRPCPSSSSAACPHTSRATRSSSRGPGCLATSQSLSTRESEKHSRHFLSK